MGTTDITRIQSQKVKPACEFLNQIVTIWGQFQKLFCTLHRSFAPYAKLLSHLKLLKSWAQGANCLAQGVTQFMKSTTGHIDFFVILSPSIIFFRVIITLFIDYGYIVLFPKFLDLLFFKFSAADWQQTLAETDKWSLSF